MHDHVAILDEDPGRICRDCRDIQDNNSLLCEFNGQAGWVVATFIKITAVVVSHDKT